VTLVGPEQRYMWERRRKGHDLTKGPKVVDAQWVATRRKVKVRRLTGRESGESPREMRQRLAKPTSLPDNERRRGQQHARKYSQRGRGIGNWKGRCPTCNKPSPV